MSSGQKFSFPFRVGRKQRRAVLDAYGKEVVVFPKGCEDMALEYVTVKNTIESARLANQLKSIIGTPPPTPTKVPLKCVADDRIRDIRCVK